MPMLYIIAGPNGAGKTTAAYSLLPEVFETVEFVNADEIARGISPLNPEGVAFHAGRIMLERINDLTNRRISFAFETTLSGLSYLKLIDSAKSIGYSIVLFFVYLSDFELAQRRVMVRVSKGGHNIRPDVIERRYYKGLRNFLLYAAAADSWYIYDNSGPEYILAAKRVNNTEEVFNFEVYNKLKNYGGKEKN
ncbi:MAG TPA: zeta toxin family protein [Chitinophagaceae bacterium]|nr:zeta toxin family protein [Chitinophagaceae bacterium]